MELLFFTLTLQKTVFLPKQEKVWSRMFYKLALQCFDIWANELAPRHKGLSRFKEKFDVLKNARVDFPNERKHYNEGLSYILESLNEIEISLCDFTEEFSEFPSRIEASTLNISSPHYDNILSQPDKLDKPDKNSSKTTSLVSQSSIKSQIPQTQLSHQKIPNLPYIPTEIKEVVESQEYSEIVAETSQIDTYRGRNSLISR